MKDGMREIGRVGMKGGRLDGFVVKMGLCDEKRKSGRLLQLR